MTRPSRKRRRLVKRCYRMAEHVASRLATTDAFDPRRIKLASLARVDRQCHLITASAELGYRAASRVLQDRLLDTLIMLQNEVDEAIFVVTKRVDIAPTVKDLFADLIALDREFPCVELSFPEQTVSVTTEPIELEGIYLGKFQIVLELRHLGQTHAYRVLAVDPNPACSCDSTTHPHVQNEELCEGEGQKPIENALNDGRLFDFFTIVNQTLHTYNAGSAYISLSDWSGTECRDCGSTVDDDQISSCSQCEGQICGECTCSCQRCDDVYCDDCTTSCVGCQDTFCGSCIECCDRCDKPFCKDCLTEGTCDDCTDDEEETTTEHEGASEPAVQSDGLGEVAFPAWHRADRSGHVRNRTAG